MTTQKISQREAKLTPTSKLEIEPKSKDNICDYCGKGFVFKRLLLDHINIHLASKDLNPVSCPECHREFRSSASLKTHLKVIHQGIARTLSTKTCIKCGKTFKNATYFKNHMESHHTKERTYICSIERCNRNFGSLFRLQRHKKLFHVEFQPCPICQKLIKNVHSHIQKSHKERKFICNYVEDGKVCSKKYATNALLKIHCDVSHRGIKKFQCKQCFKEFSKLGDMNDHVRNKHEQRKIKCEICPTLLGSKTYYRTHVLNYHSDLADDVREALLTRIKLAKPDELFNHLQFSN